MLSAGGKAIPAHPPNTGTYHWILNSVNQIDDVGATTEILQNLNLAFYLLFLHWLKYTKEIRSESPFRS